MTDDIISRADAIKVMACEMYAESQSQGYDVESWEDFIPEAKAWMSDCPSAQPKRGEWIAKTENYHSHWVCSICGGWALLEYNEQMCLSNFCPNCGARMKGADDE